MQPKFVVSIIEPREMEGKAISQLADPYWTVYPQSVDLSTIRSRKVCQPKGVSE